MPREEKKTIHLVFIFFPRHFSLFGPGEWSRKMSKNGQTRKRERDEEKEPQSIRHGRLCFLFCFKIRSCSALRSASSHKKEENFKGRKRGRTGNRHKRKRFPFRLGPLFRVNFFLAFPKVPPHDTLDGLAQTQVTTIQSKIRKRIKKRRRKKKQLKENGVGRSGRVCVVDVSHEKNHSISLLSILFSLSQKSWHQDEMKHWPYGLRNRGLAARIYSGGGVGVDEENTSRFFFVCLLRLLLLFFLLGANCQTTSGRLLQKLRLTQPPPPLPPPFFSLGAQIEIPHPSGSPLLQDYNHDS